MEFFVKIGAKIQSVINKLEIFLYIVLSVENRKWTYIVCVSCIASG